MCVVCLVLTAPFPSASPTLQDQVSPLPTPGTQLNTPTRSYSAGQGQLYQQHHRDSSHQQYDGEELVLYHINQVKTSVLDRIRMKANALKSAIDAQHEILLGKV